jgi:hypothetical protein
MSSRIAHHLDFAAYQLDELVIIGQGMLEQARYYLSGEAEAAFRSHVTRQMREPQFANAGASATTWKMPGSVTRIA